jgi:anti-sigma factor RsiW
MRRENPFLALCVVKQQGQDKMSEHIDRDTLEAYVENVLSARHRRTVEAHLTTCPTCQSRLAAAKQIPAMLYGLPRESPMPYLAARINAAIVAQRAPASAKWIPGLVLAMFAAGLGLLALAAPQWSSWVAAAATAQLPNDQAILSWLGNLVADPAVAWGAVTAFSEQALTGVEDMDVLFTLATVLLAAASIAGLVQLLGSEQPSTTTAKAQI